jgi:hypothetical protein
MSHQSMWKENIMRGFRRSIFRVAVVAALIAGVLEGRAHAQSPFSLDLGFGINPVLNGNVNSGAIGVLQGVATAILPNTYGDVYGTGIDLRIGVGWALDDVNELRGHFIFQSADADLVRMGDVGPSSLYGQYSDYQTFGLELGYRRYVPLSKPEFKVYGEATIGAAFIDAIDIQLAAPQSNIVFNNTDFYDQTAALVYSVNVGGLFQVSEKVDLQAQVGLRKISGLSEVDQLQGTGLEALNNDSGRITLPFVLGVRFRF